MVARQRALAEAGAMTKEGAKVALEGLRALRSIGTLTQQLAESVRADGHPDATTIVRSADEYHNLLAEADASEIGGIPFASWLQDKAIDDTDGERVSGVPT